MVIEETKKALPKTIYRAHRELQWLASTWYSKSNLMHDLALKGWLRHLDAEIVAESMLVEVSNFLERGARPAYAIMCMAIYFYGAKRQAKVVVKNYLMDHLDDMYRGLRKRYPGYDPFGNKIPIPYDVFRAVRCLIADDSVFTADDEVKLHQLAEVEDRTRALAGNEVGSVAVKDAARKFRKGLKARRRAGRT